MFYKYSHELLAVEISVAYFMDDIRLIDNLALFLVFSCQSNVLANFLQPKGKKKTCGQIGKRDRRGKSNLENVLLDRW